MFSKEKRALEDEYLRYKENWQTLFPEGMRTSDGNIITLDQILQTCVYDGVHADMDKLKTLHNRNGGRSHHWIGINPPPKQYNLVSLQETMASAVGKYTMFEEGSYMYTLEQNTSGGIRPHIHLFLETTTRPARIIDTLAKHFKVGKPSIDIKTYRKNNLWKEHINYILGDKKLEKMDNVNQDNIDKEECGIPKYLGNII